MKKGEMESVKTLAFASLCIAAGISAIISDFLSGKIEKIVTVIVGVPLLWSWWSKDKNLVRAQQDQPSKKAEDVSSEDRSWRELEKRHRYIKSTYGFLTFILLLSICLLRIVEDFWRGLLLTLWGSPLIWLLISWSFERRRLEQEEERAMAAIASKGEASVRVKNGFWLCPNCNAQMNEVYDTCRECGQMMQILNQG